MNDSPVCRFCAAPLEETFADKQHLIESNMTAINLGYDYATTNFKCPLPW